ncbi:hypothetical protein Tco_1096819 [Tanacetum coccineum]
MVTRWIWVRVASAVGGSHGGCVVMLVVLKVGNGVDDDVVDEVEMVGVGEGVEDLPDYFSGGWVKADGGAGKSKFRETCVCLV